MKVLKVEKAIAFYVETDDPDWEGLYRRGENCGWEQRMGESWESCEDDGEVEAAFQEWLEHNPDATSSVAVTGEMIGYPENWDTAAYPTLASAVRESLACGSRYTREDT